MIGAVKTLVKRHWPALSIRTILLVTFVFVAALPGVGAVGLRVYENTLVQQTEAELIAQGAVIAAAYRAAWGPRAPGAPAQAPEAPRIDLGTDPLLAEQPGSAPATGPADAHARAVGARLAPVIADARAVTLAAVQLLDAKGRVVAGAHDLGRSFAALGEVRQALAGHATTVLRRRNYRADGLRSPLELISSAVAIRVHHVRPVLADGRVIGAVMLSRSPRGLFVGIYQDRGKILIGIGAIFLTLMVLAGLLSRGIARPIRDLTRATERVARGEPALLDPPTMAATEIGELYAHFAAMAARIDARARYLRDFAAALSHEFKTPLAGIRGALELLGEHEMSPAERARFLANADADAQRLARLVQRLMELARADMAQRQTGACDPRAVCAGLADQGVALAVEGPQGPVPIDAETLAAILTILLENSAQAGARHAVLGIVPMPHAVLLSYADDGPGIPPGDRERVFEPFFTSRRAEGGSGLGLPIARSLLQAAGGSIALGTATRGGAAFIITLPAPAG